MSNGNGACRRPSILLITTDEQHLDTLYRRDMPYELPALHGLMDRADVYTNAYSASPVCLPARCTWMTGLMPHRNGCISNNFGASLPLTLPNLFTELKKAGYSTSMHGKCHFAPCPYPAVRPYLTQEYGLFKNYYLALGMDHLDLQDDKNITMWYYDDCSVDMEKQDILKPYRDVFVTNKTAGELPDYPLPAETHPDSWTGRKALEYLDRLENKRTQGAAYTAKPHFMWVSFSGPHYPMDVPSEYMERVDMDRDIPRIYQDGEWDDVTKHNRMGYLGTGPATEGADNAPGKASRNYDESYWRLWRQKYYANIVQIDDYVGEIIRKAEAVFGEDLLILFTSDHGDMMGNHSLWGKNSCLYNDVLRIPFVLHRPGQQERHEIPERILSTELFPTLLSFAGAQVPENIDGKCADTVVKEGGRDVIISSTEGRVAVIQGQMKLCLNGVGFELTDDTKIYRELYDLEKDPHEFVNLYDDPAYAEVRKELLAIAEDEPYLLRTVFKKKTERPYWFDAGEGPGYEHNGL